MCKCIFHTVVEKEKEDLVLSQSKFVVYGLKVTALVTTKC